MGPNRGLGLLDAVRKTQCVDVRAQAAQLQGRRLFEVEITQDQDPDVSGIVGLDVRSFVPERSAIPDSAVPIDRVVVADVRPPSVSDVHGSDQFQPSLRGAESA